MRKDFKVLVSDDESETSLNREVAYSDYSREKPLWSAEGTQSEEESINT